MAKIGNAGKAYIGIDVCEAARRRMSWIFDNYGKVVSCISGGKDAQVVFEMAYAEAILRNRPLHVAFLDQELELQSTIDIISEAMRRPGVVPLWYQVAVSDELYISLDRGLFRAWEPGKAWMRDKDPLAIHEPPPGFPDGPLYDGDVIVSDTWGRWRDWHSSEMGESAALLIGDRADETNTRYFLVTRNGAVPGVRWSKQFAVGAPTFYPIYDWSVDDVWAYIAQTGAPYNRFYDYYGRIGVPSSKARAGYLMSRNSFKRMCDIEDFEPDTFERLAKRTGGLSRVVARYGRGGSMFFAAKELPAAFPTWRDYRDFMLAESAPDRRDLFSARFARCADTDRIHRAQVRQLLSDDVEGFLSLSDRKAKAQPPLQVVRAALADAL